MCAKISAILNSGKLLVRREAGVRTTTIATRYSGFHPQKRQSAFSKETRLVETPILFCALKLKTAWVLSRRLHRPRSRSP